MSYDTTILGTSGLVYYWKLGELSGSTIADSADSNNGTAGTDAVYGQTGLPGSPSKALSFSNASGGSQSVISTANQLSSGVARPFSMEWWFKITSGGLLGSMGPVYTPPQTGTINFGTQSLEMYAGSDGNVHFGTIYDTLGSGFCIEPSTNPHVNDGNWHHLVGVVKSNNNFLLYLDGNLVVSNSNTNNVATYAGYWRLGRGYASGYYNSPPSGGNAAYTHGHVAIYNVELSAATISAHYAAGSVAAPTRQKFMAVA